MIHLAPLISCYFLPNVAICSSECVHGTCIGPDVCPCDPGWTGARCDIGNDVYNTGDQGAV